MTSAIIPIMSRVSERPGFTLELLRITVVSEKDFGKPVHTFVRRTQRGVSLLLQQCNTMSDCSVLRLAAGATIFRCLEERELRFSMSLARA